MTDEDVAVIAARDAIANYLYPCRADDLVAARAAVKAARPLIEAEARASERQRIRQLAIEVRAFYVTHEMPNYTAFQRQPIGHAFADLLEEDPDVV